MIQQLNIKFREKMSIYLFKNASTSFKNSIGFSAWTTHTKVKRQRVVSVYTSRNSQRKEEKKEKEKKLNPNVQYPTSLVPSRGKSLKSLEYYVGWYTLIWHLTNKQVEKIVPSLVISFHQTAKKTKENVPFKKRLGFENFVPESEEAE